jgi:ABC-type dipeptide/oligopeptide/nickel transport system permease component
VRRSDYLIKRALFAIVTVFVAITINFFLFRVLPGSAVRNLSRVPNATPELQQSLEAQFGLDKPIWQQYVIYVQQLFHGNLGVSFSNQQPVADNLREALANTIPMVALGTIVAIIVGVVTGVFSAWKRGTKLDKVSTNIAIAFYSFPTQWLALVLLIYLTVNAIFVANLSGERLAGWLQQDTSRITLAHLLVAELVGPGGGRATSALVVVSLASGWIIPYRSETLRSSSRKPLCTWMTLPSRSFHICQS